MVVIKSEPVKEILVHDVSRLTVKDFAILKVAGSTAQPWAMWCDGVLLYVYWPSDAKNFDQQLSESRLTINRVFYALMPEYAPIIAMDTDFGGIKVNVQNVSWSGVYKQLAAWLKARKDE